MTSALPQKGTGGSKARAGTAQHGGGDSDVVESGPGHGLLVQPEQAKGARRPAHHLNAHHNVSSQSLRLGVAVVPARTRQAVPHRRMPWPRPMSRTMGTVMRLPVVPAMVSVRGQDEVQRGKGTGCPEHAAEHGDGLEGRRVEDEVGDESHQPNAQGHDPLVVEPVPHRKLLGRHERAAPQHRTRAHTSKLEPHPLSCPLLLRLTALAGRRWLAR